MKSHVIFEGFRAGELSPQLDGQISFDKYYQACKTLTNFIPTIQGPVFNRPGFRYIVPAKYHNKKCRLVSFEFSTEQTYIIEFGDLYCRFYMNQGQIQSGGAPYEIATTYTEAELPKLEFTQSADILFIVHPNHAPAKLSRTGHTSWTLTDIPFIKRYHPSSALLTTGGVAGFDNFNAANCVDDNVSTKGWDNNTDPANEWLELNAGTGNAVEMVKIVLYINDAELNAVFDVEYYTGTAWVKVYTGWNLSGKGLGWVEIGWASVGAKQRWRLLKTNAAQTGGNVMEIEFYVAGKPSEWVTGKYPACITFFEERLWLAYLQTLWASKSGDFFNLSFGTNDDDALQYTIGSNQVNKIQWLSAGKVLGIGTAGAIYKASASQLDEAITPLNVRIVREVSYKGSAYHEAIAIDNVALYIAKNRRKIREFAFNLENDSYVAPDMTTLTRHLFDSDILNMAYQEEPNSCVWVNKASGNLLGFTYQRLEGMTAWHKHETDGLFENVACIPNTTGKGHDELWAVVNRTIGGTTKRYIEMMEKPFEGTILNSDDCFFVDSGLSYDGVPTSTISGLDHLEGKLVTGLANGLVFDTTKVVNGAIGLKVDGTTISASKVHAGLSYNSMLQTMRIERPDTKGTAQGRIKRINQCVFRLYKTKRFKYSNSPEGVFKEKIFDDLFSGDWEADFNLGFSKEGYVVVMIDKPLPATIVAIMPELDVQ
ncbi:MAG: hypothetical protein Q8J68_14765 [Methanolobus sp.]|uniref:hypothetical protein n=1 Tax=Methanolobus sp. TaxID=1874737 RepID=UPI00272F36F0|nr:hypothetical protein [Methanolobus sp.]MDP2218537.1 hypothetical protein [Methanolobus sp.]